MSFEFSTLSLPESQYHPDKLINIASQLPDTKIPLPTVDKVLTAIQEGKANQVSQLEWVYCIYAKAQWDRENPNRRDETSHLEREAKDYCDRNGF